MRLNEFIMTFLFKIADGIVHHDVVKPYTLDRCPKTKAEWEDREREFKCPKTNKANVYHCVWDPKGTELKEVCTPVVNIQGNER